MAVSHPWIVVNADRIGVFLEPATDARLPRLDASVISRHQAAALGTGVDRVHQRDGNEPVASSACTQAGEGSCSNTDRGWLLFSPDFAPDPLLRTALNILARGHCVWGGAPTGASVNQEPARL